MGSMHDNDRDTRDVKVHRDFVRLDEIGSERNSSTAPITQGS